jgi:hypothetical protein
MMALLRAGILAGCGLLFSCAGPEYDPAGRAATRVAIRDGQLAVLPEPLTLQEMERRFGMAEGQPGPRVTYRSADHPGEFIWVHYFLTQHKERPIAVVHHICRADAIDNHSTSVWPKSWIGQSPEVAASDLSARYEESRSRKPITPDR